MYKVIPTAGLSREAWLDLRKAGIGGSDAGAICGLNPYASPISVYYEKTCKEHTDYDNEAMRQGRDLEEYVANRFKEETGLKVRRSNMMYQHTEHPFMLANVDRLVVGEHAGLECKTASAYSADKWKDGKIPAHYQIQCHHYMAVTGAESWYIAVVILGIGFTWQKIKRDEALIQDLVQIESNFWNGYVVSGILPEPDGSDICSEVIAQYYPHSDKEAILLPSRFNERLKRREEIRQLTERLETEQKQIDQEIKLYMKDKEIAANEEYRITWSEVESSRLDTGRFKKEQPELARDFTNISRSRRFVVRAA